MPDVGGEARAPPLRGWVRQLLKPPSGTEVCMGMGDSLLGPQPVVGWRRWSSGGRGWAMRGSGAENDGDDRPTLTSPACLTLERCSVRGFCPFGMATRTTTPAAKKERLESRSAPSPGGLGQGGWGRERPSSPPGLTFQSGRLAPWVPGPQTCPKGGKYCCLNHKHFTGSKTHSWPEPWGR